MKISTITNIALPYAEVRRLEVEVGIDVPPTVGIDPGTVNLGIAVSTTGRNVILYQFKLLRMEFCERLSMAQKALAFALDTLPVQSCLIEGASFGDKYRQVELAEQRAALALYCIAHNIPVRLMPPPSIRKAFFGSAKVKMQVTYPDLPPDCAVALMVCMVEGKISDSIEL